MTETPVSASPPPAGAAPPTAGPPSPTPPAGDPSDPGGPEPTHGQPREQGEAHGEKDGRANPPSARATAARGVLAALRSGGVAAVTAAGLGLAFAAGLVVLVVVVNTFGGGLTRSGDILRTTGHIWLAAQRVGLDVSAEPSGDAVRLGVVPLGVSVPVAIVLVRAGRRCSLAAAAHGGARYPTIALGACALGYAALAYAVALSSATPALCPVPERAPVATFVAALVFGACGAVRAGAYRGLAARLPRSVTDRAQPLAAPARAALASGAAGALLLVVGGAAVVVASTLTHAGDVGRLVDRVADGGPETLAVGLLCAALLPNAIVCAVAYASGAGFALGVGTTVAPAEVTVGALPALPLLGAVPDAASAAGWCTLAVPVAAGLGAGLVAARRTSAGRLWTTAGTAASAGIVTGALTAAAACLATGAAGAHRLAQIGPHVGTTAVAVAAEVAVTAVVTALAARGREWYRVRRPADRGAAGRRGSRSGRPRRPPTRHAGGGPRSASPRG